MEPNGSSAGPSKQRQEELASSSTRPPGPSLPVTPFYASIRFSSSSLSDLEITIPNVNDSPLPTVADMKQQIRYLRPTETHNRRLRLIISGKVLSDHTPLKSLQAQYSRRPSTPRVTPSIKGKEKEESPDRIWIHCSMGEQLSDEGFEEEERENQTQSTLPLPVGFDRLRSAGFSDDDIASLRAQFLRFHGSRGGDDEEIDITAMEERWLDETIGLGEGTTDGIPSNSYEEKLLGFFVGYFAGLFALFFIWEPGIGISRSLKQAIVVGLCINVIVGCIRALN